MFTLKKCLKGGAGGDTIGSPVFYLKFVGVPINNSNIKFDCKMFKDKEFILKIVIFRTTLCIESTRNKGPIGICVSLLMPLYQI